ncbi:MAG: helix-turn-helix domain-containing protein [Desulfovibrio desulfuricans]|nr:helix-turn-helix domain-containing protein [Desulfovibrio desulfuricans]
MESHELPRWLSETEVSEITGISLSTLRKHRLSNIGIPYYKIGRSVRYKIADVLCFMETKRVAPRR